ncbi:MAG: DUF2513 domain-containing protein [Pseudomonas sp.]
MQRNLAIAKKILELIVTHDHDGSGVYRSDLYPLVERAMYNVADLGDTAATVDYHLYLLLDGGFLNMTETEPESAEDDEDDLFASDYFSLTWAGHDYLDNH